MTGRGGAVVLALGFLVTACGPITSQTSIIDARDVLTEARRQGADTFAPYEYTKASLYLRKAKELQGHADYQQSDIFAQRSRGMAQEAIKVTAANKDKYEKLNRARQKGGK